MSDIFRETSQCASGVCFGVAACILKTPTDRADEWVIAQVAEGRMVAATEVVERFGVTPVTAAALIRLAEDAAAPLYCPAQRVQGPEMAPGRKAQIVAQAQARDVPRRPKR